MLYIAGVLGSLIIVGFLVYPIACVMEWMSRKRKKLRQVQEHQDEASERKRSENNSVRVKYSQNSTYPYDTPERGKMSSGDCNTGLWNTARESKNILLRL